jgi:subtilisin family serine protease
MDLHRTLLKDVILPKVKSVFVVDYYEGVRGLLESRPEFPYKSIFANPRFRSKTEIIWSSDVFDSEPQRLNELYGEEKEYYAHLLYKQIQSVRELIETLKTEEGGLPLSELLSRVISNIEDKSVYCGEDQIVIVNWGLIPRQADIEGACIFKSGKFIGNWEQSHKQDPRLNNIDSVISEPDNIEDITNPANDINIDSVEESDEPGNIPDNQSSVNIGDLNHEDDNIVKEKSFHEDKSDESDTLNDNDCNDDSIDEVSIPKKDTDTKTGGSVIKKDDNYVKPIPVQKDREQYNWKKFFNDTLRGILFLLKKLWWILLAILLAMLSLFLFRDCQGPLHKVNPFYNPLPENPVIMPIEEDGVVMSENGLYQVSNNRLNIMLEKEDDDTMLEWAKAFKNHYSSSNYEIMYYNKDLYTLQIKVPVDKRLEVKNEINQVLDGFSFDCFEESVYQGDFSANDPALKDRKASWYLDAIGAYTAWDMTQGSEDVVVAVVDNGFDLNHPEFAGKVVSPYNVLSQNTNLKPITTREGVNAHGTHVAATAVGNCNNESGLLGIAPNCRLMPVQVGNDNPEGSMSNTAIIEGVLYAINNGADIVNVSLGMYAPDEVKGMSESQQLNYISNSFKEEEEMWEKVFEKAKEKDCIIVFAAGNDNIISGIDPKKRNSNTVRVSAVDPNRAKADFSNFGRYPSLNRDYSTVSAPGVAIYSASPNNQYQYMQGTSMAAPIVSGTLALMRSADRNLSAEKAIRILQETGTNVGTSIGPEINLGKAVAVALGKDINEPAIDCDKIKYEVRRLQEKIDSLSRLCPGATEPADTLKYDDAIRDPQGLDGTWKTTTQLVNTSDNTPIELFMTFKNLAGTLTIVNNGIEYTAPLHAKISRKKISIKQSGPATSSQSQTNFVPYKYNCSSDRKGNLFCKAKSSTNQVEFNLIRIK